MTGTTYNTDPELLNQLSTAAHDAVDRIIASYRNAAASPVNLTPSASALERIRALAPPDTHPRPVADVTREAFDDVFPFRMTMNHPRAMCFIPAPVSPLSWLGDLLTAGHNAHAGSWLQSPGPSAVEHELTGWLAGRVGFRGAGAGGLFVSGGSMANLTALVAARDARLGAGSGAVGKGVAYMSTQTHSSVSKALRIVGLGEESIRKVRSDEDFRMDVADLRRQLEEDARQGLKPFVVIASLGTTNTGSIDDLEAIADVSQEFDLWMHVDGAYGASIVLSKSHQHLAKGLERADSLSWDAHKWLFQTYDTGIVLAKDRGTLLRSFVNNAEYLRDALATTDQPNFWDFGLELTRPARAMKLWLTLRVLGTETMGVMIDKGFQNAEAAQKRLEELPDWQIISPAQMAIVVFRYAPPGLDADALDELNRAVSMKIRGQTVLRIVSIQPDLTEHDMTDIIDKLNDLAVQMRATVASGV